MLVLSGVYSFIRIHPFRQKYNTIDEEARQNLDDFFFFFLRLDRLRRSSNNGTEWETASWDPVNNWLSHQVGVPLYFVFLKYPSGYDFNSCISLLGTIM